MECAREAWTIAIGAGAGGTVQGSVGEGSGTAATIILKNTRGRLVQGPVWVPLDVARKLHDQAALKPTPS